MSVTGLADELLDLIAEEDPLNDALEGYPGCGDRLPDLGEAAQGRLRDRALEIAGAARAVEPAAAGERITRDVVVQQAEAVADRMDARLVEHTVVDYQTAPIGRLLGALPLVRPAGEEQERAYLARLAAVPGFLADASERHRTGVRTGRVPVAERVGHAVARLDRYLAAPSDDPLLAPALSGERAAERDALLAGTVRPAVAAYRAVLHDEIAPHGRPSDRPGLCWLPGGDATYARLARMHTTTDRGPDELHRIGLDLVERLSAEYARIGEAALGVRTIGDIRERVRADPALRWSDGEALLAEARALIERAEGASPRWIGRLPAHRCAVEPAPDPDAAGAYYVPAALDGSRPGTYFANVHDAAEQDRYLSEVTAFHEAVPGHHVQITVAQELTGLPALRRYAWINSYIEGWGLYAERLADEMGLYSGDLARLGMLAMDSLRAARLVVDTGLHAFGWSRCRVVEYLREFTLLPESEIQWETDRYIELPAQALSYMVGRLEIERLRERARSELGDAFDVRAFHDTVLGSGPLPLAVLDAVVAEWTLAVKNAS